jgi:hypothetical protein
VAGAAKAGANPESFNDALGDIFMAIANAKLSPDADLGFLNKVEMVVMGRLKTPPQPGGAQPPGSPGAGGGAPQGPPPGGAPPAPGGPPPRGNATPGGGPTANSAIPPPDMDAVRQTIAQTTGP